MNLRSPSATKLLGALALVLLAGLGWVLVLGPETSKLADVRTETENARAQNATLQRELADLKQQQKALPGTRAAAASLAAMFPATADQPGLFQAVTEAAADAGIQADDVTALTPTPPLVGGVDASGAVQLPADTAAGPGALATQTVTVSVEGSYEQTRELLANLEQIPRAYLVTGITLGAAADSNRFTTSITGDMFVMPPVPGPA